MTSTSNSNSKSSHKSRTPSKPKQIKSSSNGATSNRNRNSEFICKLKYMNNLPPIPFDPKFLVYPFDKLRFVKYHTTSLDKTYKHAMHTEPDLGIPIDLIDPASYTIPSLNGEKIPDDDMRILEPSEVIGKAPKRSRLEQSRPVVPWLRKNEFYMTPVSDELHKRSGEVPEIQFGKKTLQNLNEEEVLHFDKEKQIQAIEETFEAASIIPRHATKPELKPVEILPIFPDFDLWANRYTQVVLVEALEDKMDPEIREALKDQALIKFYGIDPARFFAYMVPKKRKLKEIEHAAAPAEGEEVEYEWVREYSYGVKKGTEPTYFFQFSKEGVSYNEITSKVTSVKSKFKEMPPLPSKITLVGKPMSAQESGARAKRMIDLQLQDFTDDFDSVTNANENVVD